MATTTLTSAQIATVKAYIIADPVLGTKISGPGTDYAFIADALSAVNSPTTLAWRNNVLAVEADDAPDYSTFDSISAGKRDSWAFFLNFGRDYSRNKTRKWITDVWGNATAGSNAEAILLTGVENAKRIEVVLGGTSKTTGTITALDRNYIGTITLEQVSAMFRV